jgi:hypothetical protein
MTDPHIALDFNPTASQIVREPPGEAYANWIGGKMAYDAETGVFSLFYRNARHLNRGVPVGVELPWHGWVGVLRGVASNQGGLQRQLDRRRSRRPVRRNMDGPYGSHDIRVQRIDK